MASNFLFGALFIFAGTTCCSAKTCPVPTYRSPLPPPPDATPHAPYGCSQVNLLNPFDVITCLADTTFYRDTSSPDIGSTVPQIIQTHGYSVETHTVPTSDGYILTMFRIPHGKNVRGNKGPVFLQHGMMSSSAQWILNAPDEKSLAFLLADNGFDVWLGNCRGSSYSQGHKTLNAATDKAYWEFSFHEMGKYDIPAVIDYILAKTSTTQINYVGHSMGTTMFFIAMSLNPGYNAKIKTAFLLAPSAYQGNSTSPLHFVALATYYLQPSYSGVNRGPLIPSALQDILFVKEIQLCDFNTVSCGLCANLIIGLFGLDYAQTNMAQLSVALNHFPDVASSKTVIHYAQGMVSATFRQFDYGPFRNPRVYNGSCTPPIYNLSLVTAPVMTFWSWNDNLATPQDVARAVAELPNVVRDVEISFVHSITSILQLQMMRTFTCTIQSLIG